MKSNTTTILIATGALLFGGIATAAYMNNRGEQAEFVSAETGEPAGQATALDDLPYDGSIEPGALQYAEVVKVDPITNKNKVYATVIGTEPVRETTTTSTPREVCEDVVVQERLPERDGNTGGTVAGAVIGGLLGNQVGNGSGRKAATAAGAVAGGLIGNKVDKNHVGGRVVNRTERQCHTENTSSESSRVTGYNVTYRNADGTTGTMRMGSKPGSRIAMGDTDKVVGYDVTYRFDGQEKTVRMDEKPGERLPVVDGKVVTQTALIESSPQG
ncbi:MAG: glycine zipper 2TM domain-containing protein [Lysobacteraceae bacterium]|nr:MAG: glycine zipper 2TM domain-containing protein [Xanthomonadaceae bacterium]